jgi:hypothetical protein
MLESPDTFQVDKGDDFEGLDDDDDRDEFLNLAG